MPHEVRMARLGRIVAAGFPHQVTQRGNRRQTIFFESADYALYGDLLAERCRKRAARNEQWGKVSP
jgi:putative transposase